MSEWFKQKLSEMLGLQPEEEPENSKKKKEVQLLKRCHKQSRDKVCRCDKRGSVGESWLTRDEGKMCENPPKWQTGS